MAERTWRLGIAVLFIWGTLVISAAFGQAGGAVAVSGPIRDTPDGREPTQDPPLGLGPREHSLLVADAHVHDGIFLEGGKIAFSDRYFAARGVKVFGFPLPVDRAKTDDLPAVVAREIAELRALSGGQGTFVLVDDPFALADPALRGRTAVFLTLEYFDGILAGNPDNVDRYRQLGIRAITLTNTRGDCFFIDDELTPFGRQAIERMNAAGIVIDIAHLTEARMLKVIECSRAPVVASHSAARRLADRKSNLSDAVLAALRRKGGYAFATFNGSDLAVPVDKDRDGVELLLDHIEYLVQRLGVDRVGLGSDYQAAGKYVPPALNEPDTYARITAGLRRRGYSARQVDQLMAGNLLALLRI